MANRTLINDLMEKVGKNSEYDETTEKVVIVDVNKKIALKKPKLLGRFHYYLVKNRNHPDNIIHARPLICEIWDRDRTRKIELEIPFKAWCEEGNEELMVLNLFESTNPHAGLLAKMRGWIRENTCELSLEDLANRNKLSTRLQKHLVAEAYTIGVTLELDFKSENDLDLDHDPPELDLHIDVGLTDSNRKWDLHLHIETEIEDKSKFFFLKPYDPNTVERKIEKKAQRIFRRQVDLSSFFFEMQKTSDDIEDELSSILQPHGLVIRIIRLSSNDEPPLPKDYKVVVTHTTKLKVYKLDKEISVTARCQIQLEDIALYLRAESQPFPVIKRSGEFMEESIKEVFLEKLSEDLVDKKDIIIAFNTAFAGRLSRVGFKFSLIEMDINLNVNSPEYYNTEIVIDFKPAQQNEAIPITNTINLMQIKGKEQLFIKEGCPDIGEYLKSSLKETLNKVLFGKEYTFLVTSFNDKVKQSIRNCMEDALKKIGYEILILTVVPDLPELHWTFLQVNINETFHLKQGIQIELNILVDLSIDIYNNNAIKKYINKKIDMNEEIAKLIKRRLKSYFHGLDHRRYFTHFELRGDEKEGEKSIAQELENLIQRELQVRLQAIIEMISIVQVNTEIDRRFKELLGNSWSLGFTLKLKDNQGATLQFFGELTFEAIAESYYHRYIHTLAVPPLDIISKLEEHLAAELDTLPSHLLTYKSNDVRDKLKEFIEGKLNEGACEIFGLVIKLLNISRHYTSFETNEKALLGMRHDVSLKKKLTRLKQVDNDLEMYIEERSANRKQLARLRTELMDEYKQLLTDYEADDEEREKFGKRIKDIDSELEKHVDLEIVDIDPPAWPEKNESDATMLEGLIKKQREKTKRIAQSKSTDEHQKRIEAAKERATDVEENVIDVDGFDVPN